VEKDLQLRGSYESAPPCGVQRSVPRASLLCQYPPKKKFLIDILINIYASGIYIYACTHMWDKVCLCVCARTCVCVCMCEYVCLCVWLSVCLSGCLSFCLSVFLSICLSICLSVCLSVSVSACVYIHTCIYMYIHIYICILVCVYCRMCESEPSSGIQHSRHVNVSISM